MSRARLWSLWEMLSFEASPLSLYLQTLGVIRGMCNETWPKDKSDFDFISNSLGGLSKLCERSEMPFTKLLVDMQQKIVNRFGESGGNKEVSTSISKGMEAIQDRIKDELSLKSIIQLTPKEAEWYEAKGHRFGGGVEDKLPSVVEDIDEGARCLGLSRCTACVFHLMRVMEIGVQQFGDKLGVSLVNAMGKEKNWQNLLDEANKRIKALSDQRPPDPLAKEFAQISSNLYNVKLAWRNEVMHPKATYTPDEAEAIYLSVRSFMRELASVL